MRPPDELGGLLTSHHPIDPRLAFAVCGTPGLLVGAGLWLGAVGSLAVGGLAFVLLTGLLVGLFAESLFVRQQFFEHGLLLSTVVPLTPRYAIPYATIDPGSVAAEHYRRTRGAADVTDAFNRRYRQAPRVGVVSFVGVAPSIANRLAKPAGDWSAVLASVFTLPVQVRERSYEFDRWYVSFRDNEAAADVLRAHARRSTSDPAE